MTAFLPRSRKPILTGLACAALVLGAGGLASCTGGDSNKKHRAPVVQMGLKGSSAGVATVLKDDTVWLIAQRYNLPMRDIIYLNKLRSPFVIHEGQRLQLPPPREYTVRSGDTLYEISRMFQTDMNSVARLNRMKSPYTIIAGQVLRMPSPSLGNAQYAAVLKPPSKPFPSSSLSGVRPSAKPAPSAYNKSINLPNRSEKSKFFLPVEGNILSGYGPKAGGLHNDGINIAAPRGTSVRAAENGVVAYVGADIEGFGNLILVRHADRYMTAYAHLSDTIVKRGDVVERAQIIGKVGATGNVDQPQLHFEIRRGTKALDPKSYL